MALCPPPASTSFTFLLRMTRSHAIRVVAWLTDSIQAIPAPCLHDPLDQQTDKNSNGSCFWAIMHSWSCYVRLHSDWQSSARRRSLGDPFHSVLTWQWNQNNNSNGLNRWGTHEECLWLCWVEQLHLSSMQWYFFAMEIFYIWFSGSGATLNRNGIINCVFGRDLFWSDTLKKHWVCFKEIIFKVILHWFSLENYNLISSKALTNVFLCCSSATLDL